MPGRPPLPEGYNGVDRKARPINDSPLAAVMREKNLTLWQAALVTGISHQMLGVYARNQAIPGYIHAMRMQLHLGIPFDSWAGTVLGKLMWEESKPDPEAIRAKHAKHWKDWAAKSGHYDKRHAARKRAQGPENDQEWLNGNAPEQLVPVNNEVAETFPGPTTEP